MNSKKVFKRLLAGFLAAAVTVSAVTFTASASDDSDLFSKVSNDLVSASIPKKNTLQEADPKYTSDQVLRVSIVLDEASTLEAGYDIKNIADDASAAAYRNKLKASQSAITAKISAAIKKDLDVVRNLTLAANIISANVEYGQIEAIEKIDGVDKVLIETKYEPAKTNEKLPVDPNMATSGNQTGSYAAWAAGYTGAGTKIAVIDTGIDDDHQSFSEAGYLYSLEQLANAAGKTLEEYKSSLGLLDAAAVEKVKGQLNVEIDSAKTYLSAKVPFAYNYVDEDYDINHDNDTQGEHGSHVEGIAAANAYIKQADGTFAPALDAVKVKGVAPDAQILTMKVFGKAGGAYDSDYMIAIEDAIVLGADSVNLSLGSGNPGTSRPSEAEYQTILENITKSGTVVTMSAGNSGAWSENAQPTGYLYLDDVSMDMAGSPGSYTNSFGVASADNCGIVGEAFKVGDTSVIYTQSEGFSNKPFTTLAGEQEYVYIDAVFGKDGTVVSGYGSPEEWATVGEALKGKIAVCSRGSSSFPEKANAAVEAGAIATIIYNYEPDSINMNLQGYKYDAPCVSITQAEGALLKANATAVNGEDGKPLYYVGKITVEEGLSVSVSGNPTKMSSFSSWGVPGSLELKPEITAPGGNIYSVNGAIAGGTSYENMSGTSMAAPQVAGMAALAAQYIKTNGIDKKTGLSVRTLAQSLLMSTAVPLLEGENYYPVLRQGAGLANINSVINASSYIIMGADATKSYADGKVKAELGDDPDRKGTYSFSFTINNISGKEETYILAADLFTQAPVADDTNTYYMHTSTTLLESTATFDCGETVTVPANGSKTVKVTLAIGAEDKAFLDQYYTSGAYVEGFVYAAAVGDEEGNLGTTHSIPVLGFYGNWSTASMFDKGSYLEYNISGTETRVPYLYDANGVNANAFGFTTPDSSDPYVFGGNPFVLDKTYMPERDALSNQAVFSLFNFSVIRNAAGSRLTVTNDTTKEVMLDEELGAVDAAFYYDNGGRWMSTGYSLKPGLELSSAKDGDKLTFQFALAPEYYADAEGNIRWKDVDLTNALSISATVDGTAPKIEDVKITDKDIQVKVKDNQYVAAVALFNNAGTKLHTFVGSNADAKAGESSTFTLDLTDVSGKKFLLQVYDYAGNIATYQIRQKIGGDVILPTFIAFNTPDGNSFDETDGSWVAMDRATDYDTVLSYCPTDKYYTAATMIDRNLYAADDTGAIYVMDAEDPSDTIALGFNTGAYLTDMAYNAKDGQIYATDGTKIYTVDKITAELTEVGTTPIDTNTLAVDKDGVFYSNELGTNKVYKYTLGGEAELAATVEEIYPTEGLQSMEYDPNTGNIIWISYSLDPEEELYYSYLAEIDPAKGEYACYNDLWFEYCALAIPDQSVKDEPVEPEEKVTGIEISDKEVTLYPYTTCTLTAAVRPWNLSDTSVTWTSSNESIATVNSKGVVTAGNKEGNVTITVTSNLDPNYTATCTVKVRRLNVTLTGGLQDTDGNPHQFSWNVKKDDVWASTYELPATVGAETLDTINNVLYLIDTTAPMVHKIDAATGEEIESAPILMNIGYSDFSYSKVFSTKDTPLVGGVYAGYFFPMQDPMNFNAYGMDFSMALMLGTGATEFVGCTSLGEGDPAVDEETGEIISEITERYALLDNANSLWIVDVYATAEGAALALKGIGTVENIKETYEGYDNNSLTSLVQGEDGKLYLAAFNVADDTSNLYVIDDFNLDDNTMMVTASATKFGNVGDNVWPAALASVSNNVPDIITDEESGITVEGESIGIYQLKVEPKGETDSAVILDISLIYDDGENVYEVQPDGTVKVTIPVPEKFKDAETIYLYREEEDGTLTKLDIEIVDGKIVFFTDHFSTYVISTTELTEVPVITTEPITTEPTTTPAETTAATTAPVTTPDGDDQKPTGLAMAIVPAVISAAGVMIAKKRNKK